MKPLLNTLFVTTQGAYLSRGGLTVAVSVDKEVRARIPIHTLNSIVCFGVVSCSAFVLQLASEHGVSLVHLTEHGRFIARMEGAVSGNVLLRRAQHRASDDAVRSIAIAQSVLIGKVSNSRTVLQRAARGANAEADRELLEAAVRRLGRILPEILRAGGAFQDFYTVPDYQREYVWGEPMQKASEVTKSNSSFGTSSLNMRWRPPECTRVFHWDYRRVRRLVSHDSAACREAGWPADTPCAP